MKIIEVPVMCTKYEAVDGTVFETKEECKKYEDSAIVVLKGRVESFKVSGPKNAWTLMGGYEDNDVVGFVLPDSASADTLLQLFCLINPWYLKDSQKGRWNEIQEIVRKAQKENDVILVGINCEGEYYFINSRQNIINNLMNLSKNEETKV